MRLADTIGIADITVLRDGEFRNLGFLPKPQEAMLVFLEHARFAAALRRNQSVRAVLTTPALAEQVPEDMALGVCAEPRLAFATIHNHLAQSGFYWEENETVIDPRAQIHPSAWVAPKNVRIGPNSIVGPRATILDRCVIGENVAVGAGSVLGAAGFQTVRASRPMIEMRHAGGLTIGDRVHVLAGAVIATGLFRQNTHILPEARIGAQSFISHAVRVGERAFIGHGAVVNGNVSIGEEAWIGPGAVVSNDLHIGDRARVSLGAVVTRDVPAGEQVSGNFAIRHRSLLRLLAETEAGDPSE